MWNGIIISGCEKIQIESAWTQHKKLDGVDQIWNPSALFDSQKHVKQQCFMPMFLGDRQETKRSINTRWKVIILFLLWW